MARAGATRSKVATNRTISMATADVISCSVVNNMTISVAAMALTGWWLAVAMTRFTVATTTTS
jgi:hypothetical protein